MGDRAGSARFVLFLPVKLLPTFGDSSGKIASVMTISSGNVRLSNGRGMAVSSLTNSYTFERSNCWLCTPSPPFHSPRITCFSITLFAHTIFQKHCHVMTFIMASNRLVQVGFTRSCTDFACKI